MRPAQGGFRVFSLAVVAIAVAAFAGVGYLVGRVDRTSQASAASVQASAASVTYRRAESSRLPPQLQEPVSPWAGRGSASGSKNRRPPRAIGGPGRRREPGGHRPDRGARVRARLDPHVDQAEHEDAHMRARRGRFVRGPGSGRHRKAVSARGPPPAPRAGSCACRMCCSRRLGPPGSQGSTASPEPRPPSRQAHQRRGRASPLAQQPPSGAHRLFHHRPDVELGLAHQADRQPVGEHEHERRRSVRRRPAARHTPASPLGA